MSSADNYEEFVKVHGVLLAASGLPQPLHRKLFQKLTAETFDGGNYFQVEPVEDGRQRRLVLTADSLPKDSDVFLVDHAWTFRLADAYKQLQEVPGLVERMAALMCVDIDLDLEAEEPGDEADVNISAMEIVEREFCRVREERIHSVRWLELEGLEIDDDTLVSLDLPVKFPHLVGLSLCDNKIKNLEIVKKIVTQFKSLKALWLNDNPILKTGDNYLEGCILKNCSELEIYNSRFTPKYGMWALGFCGGLYEKDNPGDSYQNDHILQSVESLDLSNRCIRNLITKAFAPFAIPDLSCLNLRGNPLNENSAAELLQYLRGFISLTALEVDIPGPLGDNAVDIIEALPNISLLNGLSTSKILETDKGIVDSMLKPRLPVLNPGESFTDRVISAMWLYLMTYRLADEEKIDETSVWYVMDELGSALRHSDEANFRVSPFLYMPEGKLESAVSYSILWPTENVQRCDEGTRDYLFGFGEEKQRSARLTAWFHTPQNYFIREYEKYSMQLHSQKFSPPPVMMPFETNSLLQCDQTVLQVYTDIPQVEELLTRPEFAITTEPHKADIIWTGEQVDEKMKKEVGLNDQQYINQFPYEACIVMKHHLADTIQKAHGAPQWLQPTYNLETHLTQFVGHYYTREKDGVDNLWILKPWNMARTIDTTITQNLPAVIRLMETGPKICQKYIENPALFNGRKFDLRYIVLVRSMNPLEIFLADVFWVRLANNPYSLEKHSFFEYETHFTVMNYRGRLNHKNTPEFVKEFEQEHHVRWLDIHQRVKQMIRSVFESAATVHPEMHCPTSRAIYGIDVMLDSHYQPKLLEVTYCPDCTRACKYDTEAVTGKGGIVKGSDFYNYVFGCLFLNETTHVSPL